MERLHSLATARARQAAQQALRKAKAELARAESQLDADCGVGVNLALINRIRGVERRVAEAQRTLTAIDATTSNDA